MVKSIVETVVDIGSFKSLVKVLKAAGLVSTLTCNGPLTFFAPNDEAFRELPEGELDDLLADRENLCSVFAYHLVHGRMEFSYLIKQASVGTLQGQRLSIYSSDGLRVNGAKVLKADIECTNGIMHVIDSVLTPIPVEAGIQA